MIKNILSDIWSHVNKAKWDEDAFDWQKAAACAAFSQLAYLALPEFEFEERGRFKLIPCRLYQEAAAAGRSLVTVETLREGDIQRSFVIFGRQTVMVGARMRNVVFVAVRGTSSLYNSTKLYDCRVNLTAKLTPMTESVRLHQGFTLAAIENLSKLYHELDAAIGDDDVQIYITGHSLGGAVGSILFNILSGLLPFHGECLCCGYPDFFRHRFHPHRYRGRNRFVNSAYTFGMPRYGNIPAVMTLRSPYHIFHNEDIVPRVPTRWMGYADSTHGIRKPIDPFIDGFSDQDSLWNRFPRIFTPKRICDRIMWHHNIENYRSGLNDRLK